MKKNIWSYELKFRHPFKIAAGERSTTNTVYVSLTEGEFTGYGEAALPPYLKENKTSVADAIEKFRIPEVYRTENFYGLLHEWQTACSNMPALAAMDIALHDLQGKMLGKSVCEIYGIESKEIPFTAYTIGICDADEMKNKIAEASDFHFFKLKLNGNNDLESINAFRKFCRAPFGVDVNRGWNVLDYAVHICDQLQTAGCVFIEQPFEEQAVNETAALKKAIKFPLILDESVQTFNDIEKFSAYCDGINIKLTKCGGINNAYRMIQKAKSLEMKVFIGCMSESSCGIAGAAQLAPLADWVDLDGPLLISNDPFSGIQYKDGRIDMPGFPGTGVYLK